MYRKVLTAILLGLIAVALIAGCATKHAPAPTSAASQAGRPIQIGQRFTLHSKILNEDRPYLVYLPKSYSNAWFAPRKYPVLYLLDGDTHFPYVSGLTEYMGWTGIGNLEIPELIIVAIPNTARMRDLTPTHTMRGYNGTNDPSHATSGGGENFLKFIHEELIPRINADYRTMPYNVLVGHSLGGLLALDALFQRPPIFQALIAIDPSLWWDDGVVLRRAAEWLPKQNDLRGSVYISIAKHGMQTKDYNPHIMDDPIREFAALLQTNNSPSFRSTLQDFEQETHGSVPILSTYHGLRFIFDGFNPPAGVQVTPADFVNHFAKVSARLGVNYLPPEEVVDQIGGTRMDDQHDTNAAIEWFKLNVVNYPNSFNAYARLASAYETKGDKPASVANYEKSLQMKPDNRDAREHLRRLKPPANPTGPLTNGEYQLINRQSREVLSVKGAVTNNGANIELAKFTGASSQLWTLKNQGDGFYEITAAHSGKGLDVSSESTSNGARLLQWQFKNSANQIWQIIPNGDGTYRLLNEHSGLALEATKAPASTGAPVHQWEWRNRSNQKWLIKPFSPK